MRRWGQMLAAVSGSAVVVGLIAPVATAAPSEGTPTPVPRGSTTSLHASTASGRDARPITRLIVRTADGRPLSGSGLAAAGRLAGSSTTPETRALSRGQSLVYLDTALTTDEAWDAAKQLQARTDVVWAEPDLPVYASDASPVTPNDALFAAQWDAWDTSLPSGGYSTRVPSAWNRTVGDKSVVVAVLDTGLTAHPDLTASVAAPAATDPIVKGYDFVAGDPDNGGRTYYVANDGNGRDADPSDPGDWITASDAAGSTAGGLFLNCYVDTSSWHGTHVTGTIVAKQGNSEGITGIAPGVKVQPVRVLGRCGGYSSDINDAIEWASGGHVTGIPDNPTPATVINMSLGGPGACLASTQTAISNARSRGTTVVVAAGNEGVSVDPDVAAGGSQPADCAGVVRVAASTRTGTIASYSNYGSASLPVTVAAPGGAGSSNNILSTINPGTSVPVSATSVVASQRYASYAGTSMATPHVAAAVALLQSTRVGRTAYTPDQVSTWLQGHVTAFPAGAGPGGLPCTVSMCGPGILDLSSLPTSAPLSPTVTVRPDDAAIAVSWVAGDPGGLAVTYDVETATSAGGPWTLKVDSTSATSASVAGVTNGTDYWVRVTASNSGGSSAPAVVGPVRPSAYAVLAPVATGGVERVGVTWQAPSAPPTAVTGYALRYRAVGGADWTTVSAASDAVAATLTTWPGASMPTGAYEVQVATLHDTVTVENAATDADWTPSITATVTALVNRVTVSATTLRPYRDGYQDSVVVRVATNRPGGASGSLRILNSAHVPVKIVALGSGTAWSYTWTGLSSRNLRVPNGRYYFQVYLPGTTSSLVAVPAPPSVVVASSQALKPTITQTSTVLYPVRDGYHDSITFRSTATLPSVMTWKVIRSGKVYWQTTFTRRGIAAAVYAGAKIGGGTLPAGTYALYVYAKAGEGTTTVAAKTFTVSTKKAVKTAFKVTYSAYAASKAAFYGPPESQPQTDGVRVRLPQQSAVTFLGSLPSSVLPLASVRVAVTTSGVSGLPVRAIGYYGGDPVSPNAIRPVLVTSNVFLAPSAPTVAYIGGKLRWYVENDSSSTSSWDVSSFSISGYRWVLV